MLFPLITKGQDERETNSYNKNQISVNISSLNALAPISTALLNRTSSIFGDNYFSGLGIESIYYRKLTRRFKIGGLISFWSMNPSKGGNLDQPGYSSLLSKIALAGNYVIKDGIIKPYLEFEVGYYNLHYKSDSVGLLNTNCMGATPAFGILFGLAPFLDLNMNLAEVFIFPLNHYAGTWTALKFNIGLVYTFHGKENTY